MRSLLLTLSRSPLLLLIVALTIVYSPPPQARYDMGFVVEADLETPIPGLHLALSDTGQNIATFITDADGSFSYDDLAPGQYELRVLTEGFRKPFPYFIPSSPFRFAIDGETPPDMVLALLPLVTSDIGRLQTAPFILPQSADGGRSVFYTTHFDGNLSPATIFTVTAAGEFTQLTNGTSDAYDPALSPDAERIAFTGDTDGNLDIYVMNFDGSEMRRLTDDARDNFAPVWSPDGALIAFLTETAGGDQYLSVMDADGDNLAALTSGTTRDFSPAWSPDGTRIAFASTRGGNYDIYVINADGTGLAALTDEPTDEFDPVWSPDGTYIVFSAYRDRAMFEMPLYEIQPDGSMVEMGTTMPEFDLTTYDPYRDLSLFSVWAVDLATGNAMPLALALQESYAGRFLPELMVYGVGQGWNAEVFEGMSPTNVEITRPKAAAENQQDRIRLLLTTAEHTITVPNTSINGAYNWHGILIYPQFGEYVINWYRFYLGRVNNPVPSSPILSRDNLNSTSIPVHYDLEYDGSAFIQGNSDFAALAGESLSPPLPLSQVVDFSLPGRCRSEVSPYLIETEFRWRGTLVVGNRYSGTSFLTITSISYPDWRYTYWQVVRSVRIAYTITLIPLGDQTSSSNPPPVPVNPSGIALPTICQRGTFSYHM